MDIKDALQEPLKDLNSENVQEIFEQIAKNLFNHFCIKCGEKEYYFAEIEFYYYKKDKWQHDEKIAYKRNGYDVGCFFYHLSGVDICFDSKNSDDEYGGILIRSIYEIRNDNYKDIEVTVGPLTCVNKMLNDCNGDIMPQLIPISDRNCIPKETYRYLGEKDFKDIEERKNKDGNYKFAFFDPNIDEKMWNKARPSYYSKRLTRY